ncbi:MULTISPECIES: signal recognition particle-docking protein FtsY [Neisseria]|uniref:Signal recognition particle receptor FtsY n=1 Tax=Neisseria macacae ATCC 33926 TaxID=997348 RepID=A0AA36XJF3_9NEIS|nr:MULTISPECIES: signal recognition particle-docking protein FtsY [Neisseria]EGQ75505.1 cell division protein FtsY [Neisseria macacae ATCC 33926]OHR79366.1 signal recognition particle-docking protein FtsY [Neisseria sp. HMSC70E02]UNV85069.1 signal recognition particle-docking protein FtsY [Neisseria macacae ATCC 33926]
MFSFFRRKKKQETPAQEETRIQETAAEAVENAEAAVSQTLETVQENVGEKAEELTAAVETAVESTKEHAEEICETVVEHVSETVEHVHEAVSDGSSETAEAVETLEIQAEATPATSEEHSVAAFENTAVATSSETSEPSETEPKLGWAARLKQGLTKSRDKMAKSLAGVFGGGQIDEDLYEELETVLITSDMGMEATEYLMKDVRNRVSLKGLKDGNELRGALKEALYDLIKPLEKPLVLPDTKEPFVIMLAGINGAGKTTSIGKLAKYFQAQGKSVLLAAGDTFRAAAREQLQAWGERNNVTVISQTTGDSAAVCFDAVQAAKARGIDIVLADTAGRLPTQLHLMEEIKKVKRVLQKAMPDAPHEIIVVLDANIGQNAVNQVKAFDDALGLTGLIVTKLDGTAKGGILAALASDRPVPVRYIGVGEGIDDLRPFDARAFVDALLD